MRCPAGRPLAADVLLCWTLSVAREHSTGRALIIAAMVRKRWGARGPGHGVASGDPVNVPAGGGEGSRAAVGATFTWNGERLRLATFCFLFTDDAAICPM
jgi:hypothetical protein